MFEKKINYERVVSVVGFFFILGATVFSLFLNGDPESIIQKVADTKIVIPVVHIICALATLVLVISYRDVLLISILMTESTLTILTRYEQLGTFFFYAVILLILLKGSFSKKNIITISILFVVHIVTLLLTYPHGWDHTFIAFGNSAFNLVFYIWIYILLKQKFSSCLPPNIVENKTIINKEPGSTIRLADYKLTERQYQFVLENINNNLSYNEISEKYFVSLSTVKKVFAEVFRIFNVTKIEELRQLLHQYKVV